MAAVRWMGRRSGGVSWCRLVSWLRPGGKTRVVVIGPGPDLRVMEAEFLRIADERGGPHEPGGASRKLFIQV